MQFYADDDLIRSFHGASHTWLHDVELLTMLKEFATDFVPPQESGAPGSSGGSGLYRGEQDMFCFLIDPKPKAPPSPKPQPSTASPMPRSEQTCRSLSRRGVSRSSRICVPFQPPVRDNRSLACWRQGEPTAMRDAMFAPDRPAADAPFSLQVPEPVPPRIVFPVSKGRCNG
ncbi:MAG: hypothetical protein EA423_12865 [Phycisphaerales bacterium]|nr:MAG: hypothetical protein EA423_12865 [Phycisphaerales bacterium]